MDQLSPGASRPPQPTTLSPSPPPAHLVQPSLRLDGRDPSTGIYRGRLAPSPTGYLHLGHARTFWAAQQRVLAARQAPPSPPDMSSMLEGSGPQAVLMLRNEDLDRDRAKLKVGLGLRKLIQLSPA